MKLKLTKPPYDIMSIVDIENLADNFKFGQKVSIDINAIYQTYKANVLFNADVLDYFANFIECQISKTIGMLYQYLIEEKAKFDKKNFGDQFIVEIEIKEVFNG